MWNSAATRSPAPLVSFKAGKMRATPVENRFRVEADDQRGQLQLEKGIDGATHLIWKDRQTLQSALDLLVFPGDQTLAKVDTGRAADRVYLLSFKDSSSRRFFFWMQEPDQSKDEERVREFNRQMNEVQAQANPLRGGMLGAGSASMAQPQVAAAPAVGLDELSDILSGLGYSNTGSEPLRSDVAESPNEQGMDLETTNQDEPSASEGEEKPAGSPERKEGGDGET